ncbi:ABC transporter permease [Tunicatimonas pelagia]|uniref:ABC transporter permease n=1 Tax=Tunicatimonas pelagia TaxID=931531 RepID=UPI002665E693|nr:ABC transporter permease [Tunicatimonas pelagia]WKN42166.1 ABC transporter permease [Tunicatimonas pelagia]
MIKKYFTLALRHAYRQKFHTTINIVGLALGLATSLFITWYVVDEMSYDQFHQDVERVFRVVTNGGEGYQLATTPPPLYEAIKQDIPEVESVARVFTWNHSTMRLPNDENDGQEKVFRETSIYIADSSFLGVLDFNLIAGDKQALQVPNAIVLTKATAERYFGIGSVERDEVLGKEILFGGNRTARQITGVVAPPSATHFPFDMLVPTVGYQEITDGGNWAWNIMHTYLKVRPDVVDNPERMASLADKLNQIAEQYAKPFLDTNDFGPNEDTNLTYELQAVTDIHLHSDLLREHQANGSITTVYTLVIVGVLILLLACINFMNLSTAQANRRAKEVGVRKVLGSPRLHLVFQFLFESILITLVAVLLALGSVEALRTPFNTLTGKELVFDWFNHPSLLLSLVGGVILVGLIAGSYPAFYLSAFRPVAVLKGKTASSLRTGKLRNLLIIFQFAVSIGLIITTGLVIQQLRFIQTEDIGYDRENVLVIKNDKEIQERWEDFKDALMNQSRVKQVSFATGMPSQPHRVMRDIRPEGSSGGQGMQWFLIDPDYVATLGLEVIAGRGFQEDRASDREGILLNESAVRVLGLTDPVGKTIIKNQGADDEERLQVLGVIKNFHLESFDQWVKPIAFKIFSPTFLSDYVAVRLTTGDASDGVEQVREIWSQFEPDNPFVYSFLDEDFDRLFRAEQRLGKVLSVFTVLAILVACLGLLGLASFVASQRTKEVGIRKVLGASVQQITYLLSKDFIRLVLIAFVIATPISYWLATQWLENFAYRTEVGIGIFVLAGFSALLIAWLTVSYQSVRAALANPVDSLRNE